MTTTSRDIVRRLLHQHKVTRYPIPVEKIAQKEGIEIVYAVLDGDVSGLLYRGSNGRVVIGVNKLHPHTRKRFTIAHDLGHKKLQHEGDLFVDKSLILFRAPQDRGDRRERAANEFAATLLMPEEMIQHELNKKPIDLEDQSKLESLARKFDVSVQALTYRLINLNLSK